MQRASDDRPAFTIGPAYVNHRERESGSIEVGKQADLVVLDWNLSSKLFSLT